MPHIFFRERQTVIDFPDCGSHRDEAERLSLLTVPLLADTADEEPLEHLIASNGMLSLLQINRCGVDFQKFI